MLNFYTFWRMKKLARPRDYTSDKTLFAVSTTKITKKPPPQKQLKTKQFFFPWQGKYMKLYMHLSKTFYACLNYSRKSIRDKPKKSYLYAHLTSINCAFKMGSGQNCLH